MAAAYAALVSLMHTVEQIQHHPHPPISLDKQQVQSLKEKVVFLQDFLEAYNSQGGNKEADGLKGRIASAAHVAENIIESHVVDQVLAQSTTHDGDKILTSVDLYQGLQKVIQDMDFIEKEVMEIKDKAGLQDQLHRYSTPAISSRSHSTAQSIMVGSDDVLREMLDKLTGQQSNCRIIPIVGMGGIGKTTLARNVYQNPLIVQHFDICAWVTISQQYNVRAILLEVLLCQKNQWSREGLGQMSEEELGEKLYKSISGRRYLIIIDDMWSTEPWDRIKFFFPHNNNESRIVITTRLSKLALDLVGDHGLKINFLNEDKSWDPLGKNVFRGEVCPLELEDIGKKIAKNCKGLPLSIVVIGGLLAKSKQTREYWEYIAENLNSIVNLEEDERCLNILRMSYNELPIHLKPCLLYMGIFPEDSDICVSRLIKLWVAEGFLKPIKDKSLEDTAREYILDLINRNLILVRLWGSTSGKIRFCNIHDLLRDLCLREAQREKFLCVTNQHSLNIPQGSNTHQSTSKEEYTLKASLALQSPSLVRSLICHSEGVFPSPDFRLLRVLEMVNNEIYSVSDIFQLVNSRYLGFTANWDLSTNFPFSPLYLLWNLQTLIVMDYYKDVIAPSEIWQMPRLRHVKFFKLYLPNPPNERDDFVLGSLQTLSKIQNFKLRENVIPNVKKLRICYDNFEEGFEVGSHYYLFNLGRLHKLESLGCFFPSSTPSRSDMLQNLIFPHSLKKLTLYGIGLYWEDMSARIGSLPLLQVLKLQLWSFIGPKWEAVEGQFPSLKYLLISYCDDLKYWVAESAHFPCLEHLVLKYVRRLREIPSGIGEVPTLRSIELGYCSDSAIISAKKNTGGTRGTWE